MKVIDPLTDPEAQEFDWFDTETLVCVAAIWLICVAALAVAWLADKMSQLEDVKKAISPPDDPKLPR